jgi:flagellar motility protein MotE (MotC chaperone)
MIKINLTTIVSGLTIITLGGGIFWGGIKAVDNNRAVAEEVKENKQRISVLELQDMYDNLQKDYYRSKGIAFENPDDLEAQEDFEEVQDDYRALRERLREAKLKFKLGVGNVEKNN